MLRELYLVPFEACVREAGALLIMAAYNKVNGSPMTENVRLLRDVLKREWGFAGVVVSDWHAARDSPIWARRQSRPEVFISHATSTDVRYASSRVTGRSPRATVGRLSMLSGPTSPASVIHAASHDHPAG